MSWAMRRRLLYALGVFGFFAAIFGGPLAYKYFTIEPTCSDGIRNQGETSVDRGGPCPLINPATLQPSTVLWTQEFKVRDGLYDVIAYVENPNADAGAHGAHYIFRLYDDKNVLVAEREGIAYVMPGGITPVFEGGIDTGHRAATHAFFSFKAPLVWEQMKNAARSIEVSDIAPTDIDTHPRISASVRNADVAPAFDITVTAVVFDTAGNAFAASSTHIPRLGAGESQPVVFTWPDPFPQIIGRIDVMPLASPVSAVKP